MTGDIDADFRNADSAARKLDPNFKRNDKIETWHHHEDGVTMELIPRDIHDSVPHTGGAAFLRNNRRG